MRLACFVIILATLSAAAQEPLNTSVAGHSLVLNEVFLNGAGPFRMLIDTGNASSIVRPQIARRLNLKPAYSVDRASVAGVRRVPVAILDEVRAGSVSDRSVEAIIGDVFQSGVDGVLGQSWLVRHDYLLDYRNRRIGLDGPAPASGISVPLLSEDGRPVVVASVEGNPRELVVDSGASAVVLYEKPTLDGGWTTQLEAGPYRHCSHQRHGACNPHARSLGNRPGGGRQYRWSRQLNHEPRESRLHRFSVCHRRGSYNGWRWGRRHVGRIRDRGPGRGRQPLSDRRRALCRTIPRNHLRNNSDQRTATCWSNWRLCARLLPCGRTEQSIGRDDRCEVVLDRM